MRRLRILLRRLTRTPGFTTLALVTLAVGIGANAAIFSVVWGVLLRPLPFPEPDRLVGLWNEAPGVNAAVGRIPHAPESYVLLRDRARSFESVGLLAEEQVTLLEEGPPRTVPAARLTASTFQVLRARPLLGRLFDEEDDAPGGPPIVILSHDLWVRDFGADRRVVGRTVELSGESHEIVGVMPEDFRGVVRSAQLWRPYRIDESLLPRTSFSFPMIARLVPEATVESANREVDALMESLPEAFPGGLTARMMEEARWSSFAIPLHQQIVGDLARTLWVLLGAVGFVLLIACANVANLFVVRAEGRQREVALRTALGAGRWELVRHYLTESVTLALLGGAVGLGLAWLGVEGLLTLSPTELPRADGVGLTGPVVAFTGAVSVVAGLLFGGLPLLQARGRDLTVALKEGGRGGSAGRETHRLRSALVAGQVALAVVLLVGGGLLVRSFQELRDVDPGFTTEGVLAFDVALPSAGYDDASAERFWQRLDETLATLPGVRSVGSADYIPLSPEQSENVTVAEDFQPEPGALPEVVRTSLVGPGYFETMGIDLVRGRAIVAEDLRSGEPLAVISRSLAERIWSGRDPIGRRISQDYSPEGMGDDANWVRIVGVVEDVRDTGLAAAPDEMVYLLRSSVAADGTRSTDFGMTWVVATEGDPASYGSAVREAVSSLDPGLPVMSVRTTADVVRSAMARTTFTMVLVGIAAAVALLLGVVGLYGVISYVVSQRIREIGVRMALGAEASRVRRMVVGQGLGVATAGIAAGLAAAALLTGLMESLLFGVSPADPLAFAVAPLVLLLVAAGASWVPAWRASRVDPSEALRSE